MNDTSKLTKYAINYLSKYSTSKSNLERVLKNKIKRLQVEKKDKYLLYNSIEKIIIDLEKNNFINDLNFSSSKIRSFLFQGKSRIFIKSYLSQKGVHKEIISQTLDENDIQNPDWELESAKIFCRKKRLNNDTDNKKKNLSKMARAGFNYATSIKILNEL